MNGWHHHRTLFSHSRLLPSSALSKRHTFSSPPIYHYQHHTLHYGEKKRLTQLQTKASNNHPLMLGMGTVDIWHSRQWSNQLFKKFGQVNGQGKYFPKHFLKSTFKSFFAQNLAKSVMWPNKFLKPIVKSII